ncbi:orange carotenoid protein N-terminal domain-containing protein [Chroococcidiopsis sp.]|uniref:orange carotenoid protein N-terminal domain-containing protein n=1 Tax=Chroococcidiopsis sp. TaxID=3088168 RepID=UPI003F3AA49C
MTYATDESTKRSLEQFSRYDADTQLGLLWFGYLDLKDKLTPANETSTQDTAAAVFNQFVALSQEEQMQAQRDIVNRADTDLSRAYSALASSGKLDLWLRLAQGMEDGRIIGVPSDYELPPETKEFVEQIKQLEFEQRLNFMRSAVVEMGAK